MTEDRINSYRDLKAWQKGMSLAEEVYAATARLPDEERFGLVSQMRRAAVSIPSNVAEGWGRGPTRDFARYLAIARGSTFEISTQAELCQRLRLPGDWAAILDRTDEVGRIVQGLLRSRRSASGPNADR